MKRFSKATKKTNGGVKMVTINLVKTYLLKDKIRCPNPNCEGINYLSYNELYDEEWISRNANV